MKEVAAAVRVQAPPPSGVISTARVMSHEGGSNVKAQRTGSGLDCLGRSPLWPLAEPGVLA